MDRTDQLLQIIASNGYVQLILERAQTLNMPNWYLGSGGIAQTVWNIKHGFDLEYGIKDYDLAYYDANDTSYEAEDVFVRSGAKLFHDIPVPVEIRNQARVYLWYEKHFGRPISQYKSVEESISTWPTTATSIGVRKNADGTTQVFAPFGLEDLFGLVVRANKTLITPQIYQNKVERWTKTWPKLTIIPWQQT